MRASGIKIKSMDTEDIRLLMETFTRDNGSKGKGRAKEDTHLKRARYMKEIVIQTRSMAWVNRLNRWVKPKMDNGIMMRGVVKVNLLLPLAIFTKDNGKMDQNFDLIY